MLTAYRSQKACRSCRLQLLALFEHGFATTVPRTLPLRRPTPQVSKAQFTRSFTASSRWRSHDEENSKLSSEVGAVDYGTGASPKQISMEETVMRARQTFGDTLPKDFLSAEEYGLYERLYGAPVRETMPGDLEFLDVEEEGDIREEAGRNILLKENADGEYEEIEFDAGDVEAIIGGPQDAVEPIAMDGSVQVQAQSQREVDAILRLQKDMDVAAARSVEEEEDIDEEFEEFEEGEDIEEDDKEYDEEMDVEAAEERTHPHTKASRWGTSPTTLSLPEEHFIAPITQLLERANSKHIREAAEKAFGGPGLPFSTSTPGSKKHLQQKHIGLDASQHRMSEIEADAFVAGVMPGIYAAVTSTVVEVRKRLGSSWIRDLLLRKGGETEAWGPRVLDAGAGGAGLLAWREIVQAEWDVLREEGAVSRPFPPHGISTVLTGASTLKDRMSHFIHNTTFLPRLPDYVHSANSERLLDGAPAQGRKTYDVIIAPHTLFPLKEDFRRKTHVQNLWSLLNPDGGVLILIEKGLPRGFEAIAGARSMLLDNYIASPNATHKATLLESPEPEQFTEKEKGMIIAPCTNHTTCPMYKSEGLSNGRKDFCHFSQRFIRPPFLQHLLGAKLRNHEDVRFSYLAVRRGVDSRPIQGDEATNAAFAGYENMEDIENSETQPAEPETTTSSFSPASLPRAILPPLKRRGHVTLDLCTPSGTIERWTVPKSFSTQAYRDARKSKHGDLWALGAKTRTVRNVRLGRSLEEVETDENGKKQERKGKKWEKWKGIKEGKMKGERKKKEKFEVTVGEKGMEGIREMRDGKMERGERRSKGGRVGREERESRRAKELMREMGGPADEDDLYEDGLPPH